jgi:hypothetical protein
MASLIPKPIRKMPASFSMPADQGVGAQTGRQEVGHQDDRGGIGKSQHRDGESHETEGHQRGVRGRVHEQREKRHVEHDRLRVEQRDHECLADVLAGADMQHRRVPGLGQQHAHTQVGQVGRAQPLHRGERRRIRRQHRRHTGHRQPHQDLVAHHHTQVAPKPPRRPPLDWWT